MKRVGPSTPVENLTPESVDEYVRAAGISRATQNKRFRMIRAFLNWCKREELISEAPTKRLDPPAAPDRMPKPISRDGLNNLLQTIRDDYTEKLDAGQCKEGEIIWLVDLIKWAAVTGMRFSECGRLRHKHIDTTRGLILIYRQKNRQEGTIPLSKAARDIYENKEGQPGHYLFKAPKADPNERNVGHWIRNTGRKFKRYREKAGLPDHITFHSLRHTFCTRLAEAGKNAATIQRLARHADIKTSQRYIELSSQHLQQELDSVFG
jgi:integrase